MADRLRRRIAGRLAGLAGAALTCMFASASAQTSTSLVALEGYGNLETAGVIATIEGDSDHDSRLALLWRRAGESEFRQAHDLVRIDASHYVGSLFGLQPGSNLEVRAIASDPDGVSGPDQRDVAILTREDSLPEPSLRTLYVSPTGSDTNSGLLPGSPLRTVQRAADLAMAGDLVLIAPGIYREAVSLPRSGTPSQPIVFRGDGSAVVMDGSDPVFAAGGGSWSAIGNGVYRSTVDRPTANVVTEQGRLFRYDSLTGLQALAAGAPGGFWIDGSKLAVKFTDSSAPSEHIINAARFDAAFTVESRHDLRFENLEIRYYGVSEYGKGIYLRYSDDCIVRDNRIHEIGSAGVWIKGGSRHRIEDNTFFDTSIPGWPWPLTKGSSAENNAIVLTDDPGRGHVIRRNLISGWFNGIGACGSSVAGGALTNEIDIYRNSFRSHNDDALEPEGYCSNVRLFENVIRDSHMALAVAPSSPGPIWFLRNVAWDTGNTRTSQIDGYTSSGLKINSGYPERIGPVLLYHNTFHTSAAGTDAMVLLDPSVNSVIRARNNIFAATHYVLDKINPVVLDWDYDLLDTTDSARFVKWQGSHYATLAELQANQSQEWHGVAASPMLADPSGGNFHLLPGSAAIDRGEPLPGINDGFSGTAPDIGAFEFDDLIYADGFDAPP
ncbi:MAG: right-handed parallel beta-helix repeat-containing protein [Dokdonella sp.]|nr:right-handed parallel beta-helix repeat-containing protein [Dokdonella sp.]